MNLKSMKGILAFILGFIPALLMADATTFPLWEQGAPGALGDQPEDKPTLTTYLPEPAKVTGAAIVICPGGGYGGLAGHEGAGYAEWFSQNGVAAFVLKYRLGSRGYRHPVMLGDAARALRTVRANASKWGLDPQRIGIIGSSAGGHLASTLLTHFDAGQADSADPVERVSSRPDFGILCYPVITMRGTNAHVGSRKNLLGKEPSQELIDLLSNEKQVTAQTPPCFIWHTWEDGGVKVENSLEFAAALRAAGVRYELHIYEKGGHGMGLGRKAPESYHPWVGECGRWLRERGILR